MDTIEKHGRHAAGGRHASRHIDLPQEEQHYEGKHVRPPAPVNPPTIGLDTPKERTLPTTIDTSPEAKHALKDAWGYMSPTPIAPAMHLPAPGVLDDPVNTGPLTVATSSIPVITGEAPILKPVRRPRLGRGKTIAVAVTTGGLLLAGSGTASISEHRRAEGHETFRDMLSGQVPIVPEPEVKADPEAVVPQPEPQVTTEPAPPAPEPAPAPAPAPVTLLNEVTVQPGDTVSAIANRHGVDMNGMLAANGLGAYDVIYPGQVLLLTGPAKPVPVKAPAPVPAPVQVQSAPVVAPAPALAPNVSRAQRIVSAAMGQLGIMQDCVYMVARALSSVMGGTVDSWRKWPVEYYQFGYGVPAAEAMPGDLIYYANGGGGLAHIAIYIGNGQAVHGGYNGNQTVVYSVYVGSGPQFIRLY